MTAATTVVAEDRAMKKLLFPGSFDPFTEGHHRLVCRALALADRVVVAVGVNSDKHYMFTADERVAAIAQRYSDEPRVEVVQYADMTVDCCRRVGASAILRGVRNVEDMQYEQTVATVNHRLAPDIETLLLIAEPNMIDVSSTVERERLSHSK